MALPPALILVGKQLLRFSERLSNIDDFFRTITTTLRVKIFLCFAWFLGMVVMSAGATAVLEMRRQHIVAQRPVSCLRRFPIFHLAFPYFFEISQHFLVHLE